MARLFFRTVFLLLLAVVASCAAMKRNLQEERAPLYDVRDVTVFATARNAMGVIGGVDRRVSDAIAVTRRYEPAPRVVLTVRIDRVALGLGEGHDRNEADFTVDVVSVDSGAVFATGGFKAINYSLPSAGTEEFLAETIAARIRYVFSLMTPPTAYVSPQRFPPRPAAPAPDIEDEAPARVSAAPQVQDDFIAPSVQAKLDAEDKAAKPAKRKAEEMTLPVTTPAPAVAKAKPAASKKESHTAGSDLEAGAQGRISIEPPAGNAPATTACGTGAADPCPATSVQQ